MIRHQFATAATLALTAFSEPARAQTFSAELDRALFCATAIGYLAEKNAFSTPENQAAAVALTQRLKPEIEKEFAAIVQDQGGTQAVIDSYRDEVRPQIDDFLKWRDPAALRVPLTDCFPNL